MSNKKQSFRMHYYDKVGCIETSSKQILQGILMKKPVNLSKLSRFTLTESPPANYRLVVWKLLLTITAKFPESQQFVQNEHQSRYDTLFRTLKALRLNGPIFPVNDTPQSNSSVLGSRPALRLYRNGWNGHLNDPHNPSPEHFLLMWLIGIARLRHPEVQLRALENQKLIIIGYSIASLVDDPVDCYHICGCIWSLLTHNQHTLNDIVESSVTRLKRDNILLHTHLSEMGFFQLPFLFNHFKSLFCEILPQFLSEMILDKIIAGRFGILSYVLIAIFAQFKEKFILMNSIDVVKNMFYTINMVDSEYIMIETLKMWAKEEKM